MGFDRVRWTAPKAPALEGVLAPNGALDAPERWACGGHGPEDIAVDPDGRIYTGLEDGRIVRWQPDGSGREVFADTGSKAHGLDTDRDGNLIVCDLYRGLLRVDASGEVTVLCGEWDGVPFTFCNNPHAASDGTIYWTDSTLKYRFEDYKAAFFEHETGGRLFATDPSGETRLLLDGLAFPNGVTMNADETAVLVSLTAEYSILRHWVAGPKAGTTDTFADNLPGFPDNLSATVDGTIWCALPNPRDKRLDLMLPYPRMRRAVWALPEAIRPDEARYPFVVALDQAGNITRSLHGPEGGYAKITGAREHDGWLYLASIDHDDIARVAL